MSVNPGRTYEIQEVAELSGIAPARLRAWERRYAAVRPIRQANGYRAYSAEQVGLLIAYAQLVAAGDRIGDLVARPVHEILAAAAGRDASAAPHAALLAAARALDRDRLARLVAAEIERRGLRDFAESLAIPLAQDLGELWALGAVSVAAEHLASEVVVHALKGGLAAPGRPGHAVIAACLPGERHEWGLLSVLAGLQEQGWRVLYLGPDLPVDNLLDAAWSLRPAAAAVSASDPAVVHDNLGRLAAFASRAPEGMLIAAGGAGVPPHARLLGAYGIRTGIEAFALLPVGPAAP